MVISKLVGLPVGPGELHGVLGGSAGEWRQRQRCATKKCPVVARSSGVVRIDDGSGWRRREEVDRVLEADADRPIVVGCCDRLAEGFNIRRHGHGIHSSSLV